MIMSKTKKLSLSYYIDYGIVRENKTRTKSIDCASRKTPRIIYKNENIADVYQRILGKAIEEYNAKQTRSNRKKEIAQIICSPKVFREVVVKIKNSKGITFEIAKNILEEYMRSFETRNPCLIVFNAEMFFDDMPQLHIDFIPICHGHKRGLSTAISFKGALAEQGFYSVNRGATEQIVWAESEKQYLNALLKNAASPG